MKLKLNWVEFENSRDHNWDKRYKKEFNRMIKIKWIDSRCELNGDTHDWIKLEKDIGIKHITLIKVPDYICTRCGIIAWAYFETEKHHMFIPSDRLYSCKEHQIRNFIE